jgi:ubiquinol-cytochrome c reductase cytochrome b subunit
VRDELEGEQLAEYNGQLAAVAAAVAAESGRTVDETDAELVAEGRRLIVEEMGCIDCHKFGDDGELGMAPDLTGYASREWLIEFLNDPTTERFYLADNYGEPARMMPAFAPHRDEPVMNVLTDREIELIVDWLRGKWATSTLSE